MKPFYDIKEELAYQITEVLQTLQQDPHKEVQEAADFAEF